MGASLCHFFLCVYFFSTTQKQRFSFMRYFLLCRTSLRPSKLAITLPLMADVGKKSHLLAPSVEPRFPVDVPVAVNVGSSVVDLGSSTFIDAKRYFPVDVPVTANLGSRVVDLGSATSVDAKRYFPSDVPVTANLGSSVVRLSTASSN